LPANSPTDECNGAYISAKDYMNLVKNKGKLAVWIYTKSGLQGVEQYTPQIYDLGVIQEQVDEEENARIEELSLGGSLTLPLPSPEANSAMETEQRGHDTVAADQEGDFNLEDVVEETLNLADRKMNLFEDLDPLDPMGTVLERALELGVQVVVARSRLVHHRLMNSFEVSSYISTEIPQDVPPVEEMNYPYEYVDFVYAGVRAAEAREILMREVVDRWLLKYYPDAVQTVQFMLKTKTLNEISQLCCAPSQLYLEVERMRLVMCKPIAEEVLRVDNDKDPDPVRALPKLTSETIIQIELSSATDPFNFLNEVNNFFSEMAPEHEGTVVDLWELKDNLCEAKITDRKEQMVRI
jgi:hypothetical protein